MDNDNQEKIYCADDNKYRIHFDICDNFAIYEYCVNHLKPQTHVNSFSK